MKASEKKKIVSFLTKCTNQDRRMIKRMKKLGASNSEIAKALELPEDSPLLQE